MQGDGGRRGREPYEVRALGLSGVVYAGICKVSEASSSSGATSQQSRGAPLGNSFAGSQFERGVGVVGISALRHLQKTSVRYETPPSLAHPASPNSQAGINAYHGWENTRLASLHAIQIILVHALYPCLQSRHDDTDNHPFSEAHQPSLDGRANVNTLAREGPPVSYLPASLQLPKGYRINSLATGSAYESFPIAFADIDRN